MSWAQEGAGPCCPPYTTLEPSPSGHHLLGVLEAFRPPCQSLSPWDQVQLCTPVGMTPPCRSAACQPRHGGSGWPWQSHPPADRSCQQLRPWLWPW